MLELLGFRLARPVAALVGVALAIAAVVAFVAWERREAAQAMGRAVAQAREDGRAACEARWRSEIARSNAQADREKAAQAAQAAQAQASAQAQLDDLRGALADMERTNAALPDGARCGLGRDRVRLLPR